MKIVTTYDRSDLIERSIATLTEKLIEESIIVSLVIVLFLFHFRSALVPILTLPLAILLSFAAMHYIGLGSNIMSLGGIAIAIGAMVDAAIIMVENAHTRLEEWEKEGKAHPPDGTRDPGGQGGGAALFFSLLIITVSFLPIFTLEAQEGRLFKPLAFTKTFAMFFAAFLSVTLAPGPYGPSHPGKDHSRGEESHQPLPHLGLSSRSPFRPAPEKDACWSWRFWLWRPRFRSF